MAGQVPQTMANHGRFDPLYHFFMLPASLLLLVWAVAHLVRHPSNEALALIGFALLLLLTIFKFRTYALKVQDRVIRIEEKLRFEKLLPLGAPVPALREGQWVALRFASDAELPSLAEKAAAGNLNSKQIKQAIQNWRPDYWRV
jgi:hypothetical protein